jgi:hypothetical protein
MAQRRHIVNEGAASRPVQIAGDALAQKLAPARARQRAKVGVGEMGEAELHGRH